MPHKEASNRGTSFNPPDPHRCVAGGPEFELSSFYYECECQEAHFMTHTHTHTHTLTYWEGVLPFPRSFTKRKQKSRGMGNNSRNTGLPLCLTLDIIPYNIKPFGYCKSGTSCMCNQDWSIPDTGKSRNWGVIPSEGNCIILYLNTLIKTVVI